MTSNKILFIKMFLRLIKVGKNFKILKKLIAVAKVNKMYYFIDKVIAINNSLITLDQANLNNKIIKS